jgi:hypothetical protein
MFLLWALLINPCTASATSETNVLKLSVMILRIIGVSVASEPSVVSVSAASKIRWHGKLAISSANLIRLLLGVTWHFTLIQSTFFSVEFSIIDRYCRNGYFWVQRFSTDTWPRFIQSLGFKNGFAFGCKPSSFLLAKILDVVASPILWKIHLRFPCYLCFAYKSHKHICHHVLCRSSAVECLTA